MMVKRLLALNDATMPSVPRIMGVINLSPHSFYHSQPQQNQALKAAERLLAAGADILDVGAIATNPSVNLLRDIPSEQAELDNLIPFIEKLSNLTDKTISVDTYRPRVMRASVAVGASMINDQHALHETGALSAALDCAVPVCLMHHFREQRPAQQNTAAMLAQIIAELRQYAENCLAAGMQADHIILDPGFGSGHFAKNTSENFYLLAELNKIVALGYPVLVGLSRKSFIGECLKKPVSDRLAGSLACAMIAAQKGAAILRVHDVAETVAVMKILQAVKAC